MSLGADGARGVGAWLSCLRAQRGRQVRVRGRAEAGPCGVVTAGRGMGRAGVALGCPERHSCLPGPRPEAAAGGAAEGHRGAGRPHRGWGPEEKLKARLGAGKAGAELCGRPWALPPAHARLPAGSLGSSRVVVTAGCPLTSGPARVRGWSAFSAAEKKRAKSPVLFTRSFTTSYGYTSYVKFVLQKLSLYPLNPVGQLVFPRVGFSCPSSVFITLVLLR